VITVSGIYGITSTNIHIIRVLKERRESENFPNLGKETDIQIQETQSSKQDEPKETHTETHYNEIAKSKRREATCYIQGNPYKDHQQLFQ